MRPGARCAPPEGTKRAHFPEAGGAPACGPSAAAPRARRLPAAPIKVIGKSDTSGGNMWVTTFLATGGTSLISANTSVLWPACVQHVAANPGMRTALKNPYTLGCAAAAPRRAPGMGGAAAAAVPGARSWSFCAPGRASIPAPARDGAGRSVYSLGALCARACRERASMYDVQVAPALSA